MSNDNKIRCEYNTLNCKYKNISGEEISFQATLTGHINIETNETFISDHLEITKDSTTNEISDFALQEVYQSMSEDLDEQLKA